MATTCPQFPSESCISQEVAAVMATVSKSAGEGGPGVPPLNGGPLATTFGTVAGIDSIPIGASAISARGTPKSLKALYPFALSSCVVNDYFARSPRPNPPTVISDVASYTLSNGRTVVSGRWTDLLPTSSPGASLLVGYVDYLIDPSRGQASPEIQAGSDTIYLDPGGKAVVYHETDALLAAGKGLVMMPVVDGSNCNLPTGAGLTVTSFAAFQITATTGNSISGYFVGDFQSKAGGIGGTSATSNAMVSAVLVE